MSSRENEKLQYCRGLAAIAWTKETTSSKPIDVDVAEEFAKILLEEIYKPNLGSATTSQLLEELMSREPHIKENLEFLKPFMTNLAYRTTD